MALKPAGGLTHLGRYLRPTKSEISVAIGERNTMLTGEQVKWRATIAPASPDDAPWCCPCVRLCACPLSPTASSWSQIHKLRLSYAFTLKNKTEVRPMLQNLSDFLYEGSTQGQLWFLHSQDGQVSRRGCSGVKVPFCAKCTTSSQTLYRRPAQPSEPCFSWARVGAQSWRHISAKLCDYPGQGLLHHGI
jgi:hypothetical protein